MQEWYYSGSHYNHSGGGGSSCFLCVELDQPTTGPRAIGLPTICNDHVNNLASYTATNSTLISHLLSSFLCVELDQPTTSYKTPYHLQRGSMWRLQRSYE
jgi:hypothetical protein